MDADAYEGYEPLEYEALPVRDWGYIEAGGQVFPITGLALGPGRLEVVGFRYTLAGEPEAVMDSWVIRTPGGAEVLRNLPDTVPVQRFGSPKANGSMSVTVLIDLDKRRVFEELRVHREQTPS